MKVLFQTLFGSKLYGTDTPESDTDYKAVFLPPLSQLLRGDKVKNSVKSTGHAFQKNGVDDEDFEMIPLQVLCRDFIKGQTYALEVVFNAIQNKDDCDPAFHKMCVTMSYMFLTRNVRAMVGYALNQASKYGVKGTRLNTLLEFKDLVDSCDRDVDEKLGDCIRFVQGVKELEKDHVHLEQVKYNGPKTTDPAELLDDAVNVLGKTFGYEITFGETNLRIANMLKSYGGRAHQARENTGHDWKAISHALRIIDQAIDVLTNRKLVFPLPKAEYYKRVKLGQESWESVKVEIETGMVKLEQAQEQTTLPESDAAFMEKFYAWFDSQLLAIYQSKPTTSELTIEPKFGIGGIDADLAIDGVTSVRYIDPLALLSAVPNESTYDEILPFTCSCGVAGCAGIHDSVMISCDESCVRWSIPPGMGYEPEFDGRVFSFDVAQYESVRKSIAQWLVDNKDEVFDDGVWDIKVSTVISEIVDSIGEEEWEKLTE